jgi:membrane-bound lytic murein transglycosylase F
LCLAAVSCKQLPPQEKTLTVVAENNILGCVINDTAVNGFQYEIIKSFADTFNYKLNIVLSNNLETSLEMLKNGEADVLARALPTTLSLKNEFDFTIPLYTSNLVLVQHKNGGKKRKNVTVKTLSDLEGKTVCVLENSPYIRQLHFLVEDSGIDFYVETTRSSKLKHLAEMIDVGKIPYLAIDKNTAVYLQKLNPNLDIETKLGLNQFMAWAVSKQNQELKNQLDDWLATFLQEAEYREILRKYF